MEARKEELVFMEEWQVWDVVPVAEAWAATGRKPIGGRWVDHNKGDTAAPNIRSRYVAKEIATYRDDSLFAATPPLEAIRLALSHAATGRSRRRKVLLIDVRKAHLHAEAERTVFVDLPPEAAQPGMCARLRRCLYGTRDAAARWEALYTKELKAMGFIRGRASACCFYHPVKEIRAVVHGDDFTFVGEDAGLDWVEKEMAQRFLCKVEGRLGGGKDDLREARLLNRVLRWTPQGLLYEADPRHVEILAKEWLTVPEKRAAPKTPGSRREKDSEEEESLVGWEATRFRGAAARVNYLAQDRPDVAFAAKECCRCMSAPKRKDEEALRRLIRYLAEEPRKVYEYPWQEECGLRVFVDTDFAGCTTTRRSTSGGCAMRGAHLIKHWATTQKTIALSSGEAELAGIVKGSSEGLGMVSMAADLGLKLNLAVYADSSAAIGICRRTGIGKVRHLAVGQLWVQERVRNGDFDLFKHPGVENPADLLTKHLDQTTAAGHLQRMNVAAESGRARSAPAVV